MKIVPFPESGAAEGRLDSWKEIAGYLNRGTRTVQRWEREEGLPVHRLRHDQGSTVYAYKAQLDVWWASRRALWEEPAAPKADPLPSVAVLPFADMSQEKDQEYFCEGMAEEIINALSRLTGLYVASRTSSFQFKGAAGDSRRIGQKLGVSALLEGSVRKWGGHLRIAVQLSSAASGFQLWSARYDRETSDVFAVQDEIARQIVEALRVTLTPEERGSFQKPPTSNFQAYDYYLRGRKMFYEYDRQSVEFAIQLFTRATELDPVYALAHAGLADCWSYVYLYADRDEAARRKADQASWRAVELAPRSAQAQASRAVALSLNRRDDEAEKAFLAAIRLDPNLFEVYYFYARHCFVRGQLEQAAKLYEQAARVRPEDYQSPLLVSQIYDDLKRPAEARASRERGVRAADELLRLDPNDARALYMAANGLVALGDRERGLALAERALRMKPAEPMVLYNVGCIFSLLGKIEEALQCLEKAVENGLTQRGWFENDSNLDSLREQRRFHALTSRLP